MNSFKLVLFLLVCILFAAGCATVQPGETQVPNSQSQAASTATPAPTEIPLREVELDVASCAGKDLVEVDQVGSLADTMAAVMGAEITANNSCVSIFNLVHGNRTNVIYIKHGWAFLNLPLSIFTVWEGDKYLVGSPTLMASDPRLVIDEDTITVDGGIRNILRGDTVVDSIDWSTVSGGVFDYEVRFESSRMEHVNNQRVWTATCNGQTFQNLNEAVLCGLNGNDGW